MLHCIDRECYAALPLDDVSSTTTECIWLFLLSRAKVTGKVANGDSSNITSIWRKCYRPELKLWVPQPNQEWQHVRGGWTGCPSTGMNNANRQKPARSFMKIATWPSKNILKSLTCLWDLPSNSGGRSDVRGDVWGNIHCLRHKPQMVLDIIPWQETGASRSPSLVW